jgi:hypothetical protein
LAINAYLAAIHAESVARGYSFARNKLGPIRAVHAIAVTEGQVSYEWEHLLRKLSVRSPTLFNQWQKVDQPACHPLFRSKPGPVESWERLDR